MQLTPSHLISMRGADDGCFYDCVFNEDNEEFRMIISFISISARMKLSGCYESIVWDNPLIYLPFLA